VLYSCNKNKIWKGFISVLKNEKERIKNLQTMDFSLPEAKIEVLNLLELLRSIIMKQQQEIQELKDEINRIITLTK